MVIDESLIDLESLQLAREMGYTGVGVQGVQGADAVAAAGGRGAEVRDVPLRAGPDVRRGVADSLGRPGGAHPRRGGDRVERPAVLPGGERAVGTRSSPAFTIRDGTMNTAVLNGLGLRAV